MTKKRIQIIPEVVSLKCPRCFVVSRRKAPKDASPQYFDCDKCSLRSLAPASKCCVICAFSCKKCVPSLMMEAKMKNLEIRE